MGISLRRSIAWLPAAPSEPTSTVVLTSPARRFVDLRVTTADQSLEWGIAGTSSYRPLPDGRELGQWRHWIDSLHAGAEEVVDEGVCSVQADGSMLEVGSMVNPATGALTDYEEVWEDRAPGGPKRCVVWQHEAASGSRGLINVYGEYCQGLVRTAAGVQAERLELQDGAWTKTFSTGYAADGEALVPCQAVLARVLSAKEGDVLEHNGLTWTAVEVADLE